MLHAMTQEEGKPKAGDPILCLDMIAHHGDCTLLQPNCNCDVPTGRNHPQLLLQLLLMSATPPTNVAPPTNVTLNGSEAVNVM